MTRIAATHPTHWTTQVTKSVGLAISSIGLGWLMNRFWRGPEACSAGLVVGALSGNVVAFAAGSSLCLPSVAASPIDGIESPLIKQCIKENFQKFRGENLRIAISSNIVQVFADKAINSSELPPIIAYLKETDQLLSADIKAQDGLRAMMDEIAKREPIWHDFFRPVSALFLKLNEQIEECQRQLRGFVLLLEQAPTDQSKVSASQTAEAFSKLFEKLDQTKLANEGELAHLLSVLNAEVLYKASEIYHFNKAIAATKTHVRGMQATSQFAEAAKSIGELKKLIEKDSENRLAFERNVRAFERATTVFAYTSQGELSSYIEKIGRGTIEAAEAIRKFALDEGRALEALNSIAEALITMLRPIMGPRRSFADEQYAQVNNLLYYLKLIKGQHPQFDELLRMLPKRRREALEGFLAIQNINEIQSFANIVKGRLDAANKPLGNEELIKALKEQGVEGNVQALANYAEKELGGQKWENLPNPQLWADEVNTLLDTLWSAPNMLESLKALSETGTQFQRFVTGLQTSPQVFQKLISNYRSDLEEVQKIIKGMVSNDDSLRQAFIGEISKESTRVKDQAIEIGKKIDEKKHEKEPGPRDITGPYTGYFGSDMFENTLIKIESAFRSSIVKVYNTTVDNLKNLTYGWGNFTKPRLETLNDRVQKANEIDKSKQLAYRKIHRALRAFPLLERRKLARNATELIEALTKLPKTDETTLHIMHHLSLEERTRIQNRLRQELDQAGSPLNIALQKVDISHVLLEAFIQLGFNPQDRDLKEVLDRVVMANALRSQIKSWDIKHMKKMPYIQIEIQTLAALEELQKQLFGRMAQSVLATDSPVSGHFSFDSAQEKLGQFNTILSL